MYRKPAPVDPLPNPPSEHVYECRARRRGLPLVVLQIFFLPLAVAAFLLAVTTASVAIVGFALSAFLIYRWWKPKAEHFRFIVREGYLRVFKGGGITALVNTSLGQLENIV